MTFFDIWFAAAFSKLISHLDCLHNNSLKSGCLQYIEKVWQVHTVAINKQCRNIRQLDSLASLEGYFHLFTWLWNWQTRSQQFRSLMVM